MKKVVLMFLGLLAVSLFLIGCVEEPTDEEVKAELDELKPSESVGGFESEQRKICPKCGAVGYDIKVIEDKSKILSYIGNKPMYAKKSVCKKCGQEF